MSPQPPALRVGQVLASRYELVRQLGAGGMGVVYEARHVELDRRLAIKLLRAELAADPEAQGRFRREARAAASLHNDHIVSVSDFGLHTDGTPFLVMELLQGEPLRQLLARAGPLPVPRAASAILQACRGIEAAHQRGIIHRDLKPENLFVTPADGGLERIKVLDFGIAKLSEDSGSRISTETGAIIGTLHYMPPEQIRSPKIIDPRADIHALGAILYECLSGRVPHPGQQPHEVMYHILHESPVPLSSLRSHLPEGLVEIVHQALEADPERRWESAAALGAALARFARPQHLDLAVAGSSTAVAQTSRLVPEMLPADDSRRAAIQTNATTAAPAGPGFLWGSPRTALLVVAAGLVVGGGFVGLHHVTTSQRTKGMPSISAGRVAGAPPETLSVRALRPAPAAPAPPGMSVDTGVSEPVDGHGPEGSAAELEPHAPGAATRSRSPRVAVAPSSRRPTSVTENDLVPAPSAEPDASVRGRAARGRKRAVVFDRANPY